MRGFANQLDLSEQQRAKIGPIVKRTAAQLGRNRREVQLTAALAIERMQDEIADLLNHDQRTKFEELISKQRGRLEEFRQSQPGNFQGGAKPPQPEPPK